MNFFVLIINFIIKFTKINNKNITIFSRGFSGSNTLAFKKSIYYEKLNSKYNVEFIDDSKLCNYSIRDKIKLKKRIYTSKLIISTHGSKKTNKKSINIDLWHGIPLKTMNLMDKNEKNKKILKNIDFLASNSDFNSTLFNSCFGMTINNYIKVGSPRLDLLINSDGNKNLNTIFENDYNDYKKIFLFPTYRSRNNENDGSYNYENIFGFEVFDYKKFDEFLNSNNLKLFLKLHPNDEKKELNKIKSLDLNNLEIITNALLEKNYLDLYEVLNSCDLLITDYSSIYFDYLMLNKPIIFNPVDLNDYKTNRGFLLEPYDFWTPGPKVYNQNNLEKNILKLLENNDSYVNKRINLKNIFFESNVNNSSKLLYDFILSVMEG